MDCEKLDAMAMDLVDPDGSAEIDPRRLQEADEHLAGCSRCTQLIDRLRDGMRAAERIELDDPSSLLESRILAAASAAKPPPSLRRRALRAVSAAGAWAMRPQVAMAAVLVLMVGSSIVLLRGGLPGARRTKVTDEGTPVATLEPAQPEGAGAPAVIDKNEGALEEKEKSKAEPKPSEPPAEIAPKQAAATDKKDTVASGNLQKKLAESDGDDKVAAELPATGGAGGKGGAPQSGPQPAPTTIAAAPAAPPPPAGAAAAAPGDEGVATKTEKKSAAPGAAPSFDESMTAYKEGQYAVAAKGFDAAAAAGTKTSTSLLYAARSFRALGSCVQAIPRFQKVLASHGTSPEAPNAALEGGQCAKAVGDLATARSLFERAKTYPATQKQAEAELAKLDAPPAAAKPPAKAKAPAADGY